MFDRGLGIHCSLSIVPIDDGEPQGGAFDHQRVNVSRRMGQEMLQGVLATMTTKVARVEQRASARLDMQRIRGESRVVREVGSDGERTDPEGLAIAVVPCLTEIDARPPEVSGTQNVCGTAPDPHRYRRRQRRDQPPMTLMPMTHQHRQRQGARLPDPDSLRQNRLFPRQRSAGVDQDRRRAVGELHATPANLS